MPLAVRPIPEEEFPAKAAEPSNHGEIRPPARAHRSRAGYLLLAVGLLMIGFNLRIGVASVGPVLGDIQAGLGMSASMASLLTTIPVFAFGAFAFLTPGLVRRIGMHRLLGATMIVLAAGIGLRLAPNLAALFAGTILVGAAIAIANVVLPAAIKQDFSDHSGLVMGLYSTALSIGAAMGSGLTVPMLSAVGGSWRGALALWAVPAALAFVIWIPQIIPSPVRRRPGKVAGAAPGRDEPRPGRDEPRLREIISDPIAIGVTAFMGLQSMSFYASLTWIPTLLQDAGMDAHAAGWMLSYSAIPSVLAALISPALARRMRPVWLSITVAAALTGAAYLGLAIAPTTAPYLWMTLLGLGQGASIALALSYIVWRSPDFRYASRVSTMAQGFGYLLAGFGPIGLGALYSVSGGWVVPLSALGVLLIAQIVAGAVASRPEQIRVRRR